jgi:hypothetical protein
LLAPYLDVSLLTCGEAAESNERGLKNAMTHRIKDFPFGVDARIKDETDFEIEDQLVSQNRPNRSWASSRKRVVM